MKYSILLTNLDKNIYFDSEIAARRHHAGQRFPSVLVRIVSFARVQPFGTVVAAHNIQKSAQTHHANTAAPRAHRRQQCPNVVRRIVALGRVDALLTVEAATNVEFAVERGGTGIATARVHWRDQRPLIG